MGEICGGKATYRSRCDDWFESLRKKQRKWTKQNNEREKSEIFFKFFLFN